MIPTIPLDSFHLCVVDVGQASGIALISLSLIFGEYITSLFLILASLELNHSFVPLDVLVFVSVVVQVGLVKSVHPGVNVNVPSILNTVTKDAVMYFAVISSSHVWAVIMYSTATVGFFGPVLKFTCTYH